MSIFTNCHCNKKVAKQVPVEAVSIEPTQIGQKNHPSMATPPALVYKTRKDYSKNIPVLMNAQRTKIISYPHPTDIFYHGKLAYPTPLAGGFLLDNRGIDKNVVFLSYTYESYSQLKEAPTIEQLMDSIVDKLPLVELWDCGPRNSFKDEVTELNVLIEKGFPGCELIAKEVKVQLRQ